MDHFFLKGLTLIHDPHVLEGFAYKHKDKILLSTPEYSAATLEYTGSYKKAFSIGGVTENILNYCVNHSKRKLDEYIQKM